MDDAYIRDEFKSLLAGSPNGAVADRMMPFADMYAQLLDVFKRQGMQALHTALNDISRTKPGKSLMRVLSTNIQKASTDERVPALPGELDALITEHTAPCGRWIDQYIEFAQQAAPMSPRSFHEAAALFLISTAIARRVKYPFGADEIYPNLFILFIAPPAIYTKTTGSRVMGKTMKAAGIDHLLLSQTITPQALINEMSTSIPARLAEMSEESLDQWLNERAFASQRAWRFGEAGQLFEAIQQEYNAGLTQIILQLYDCEEKIEDQTQSRGRITACNTYLTMWGVSTPGDMQSHMKKPSFWSNGLASRFCIVLPDTESVYAELPPKVEIPAGISSGLRAIFSRFPIPCVKLVESDDPKSKGKKELVIYNKQPAVEALLSSDARMLHSSYSRTIGYQFAKDRKIESPFDLVYHRYSVHALKLAIILAVADDATLGSTPNKESGITVQACHMARAIRIVERWRASFHALYQDIGMSDELRLADKVILQLTKRAMTARELMQQTHAPTSTELLIILKSLQESGMIESMKQGKRTEWSITSVASVAKCSKVCCYTSASLQSPETASVASVADPLTY
jgi:hypothetical protein